VIAVIPIIGPFAFLRVNAAGRDRAEEGSEAIAQALGAAERTVESPMSHVWGQLGRRSRGQAAAWGREHRLGDMLGKTGNFHR
jgi:Bacterial regulatory proteins, luxR family.